MGVKLAICFSSPGKKYPFYPAHFIQARRCCMKVVIATKNKNKVKEIKEKFRDVDHIDFLSLEEYPQAPDVIEDGSTFEENALKKARAISEFTGLAAMADDSGLEVDALEGRPGIYSARYAGENATDRERNEKLLREMEKVEDRKANFTCVIAIALPDGSHHLVRGTCDGTISLSPSGEGGFGYDPVFFLPQYDKTMAEIPLEEKNRISHRAHALEGALKIIETL